MSVDELLKAADSLSESDLENLATRVLFLRARRKGNALTADETVLLERINAAIPIGLHQEYLALVAKRDDETIAEAEYDRMLVLGDRIDDLAAERAHSLVQLAMIRQVSLMQLMDELGIQGPGVR
jgi:hypothetical protein